jgi:outer membrane protein OmpU
MRKLLLASVAVLSAGIGIVETAQAQDFPNPGQVTVRLNGRFRFYATINNQSNAQNNLQGSPDGVTPLTGSNKLADYEFTDYGRLYPGFDGVAANGLKYGASMEIRTSVGSGAGYGIYGGTGQQVAARNPLYLYKDWGYIGTDKLGTLRFGQTDNVTSLYVTGTYENFNDGGWDGDMVFTLPGNLIPAFPFLDYGPLTTLTRAVYLSPQIFGFDFGVSFAPSTGNGNDSSNCGTGGPLGTNFVTPAGALQATVPGFTGTSISGNNNGITSSATAIGAAGANGQSIAGPGCDALSATPTADNSRPRNIWDGLLRYRGSFGDFGIAATAGYLGSGTVAGNAAPSVGQTKYDGYSVGDFGLAVTYGGLSVGGHYTFGKMNGGGEGLLPKNAPQMSGWLVGASYTVGPLIVGASYFVDDSAGDITSSALGNQLHEVGLAAGGTYSIAPGLALFFEYAYGERRQHGYNFITGTNVSSGPIGTPQDYTQHNKVTSQVIGTGISFAW